MPAYRSASGSSAEDLFIELFSDIYQNSRFADFLLENGGRKVAIEIGD